MVYIISIKKRSANKANLIKKNSFIFLKEEFNMVGEKVVLRTRMSAGDAHYAGELVEGAHIVTAWGDVGTELAIRLFGDESLFLGYSEMYLQVTSWNIQDILKKLATHLLHATSKLTKLSSLLEAKLMVLLIQLLTYLQSLFFALMVQVHS